MDQGRLVVIGITQEQHAGPCRLFAQWKGLDFPIAHDPINVTGNRAVPMYIGIDEHGIVRSTRPRLGTFEAKFLNRTFPAPEPVATRPAKPAKPKPADFKPTDGDPPSADAWRAYGDALVLWGKPEQIDEAIGAYGRAIEIDPTDGAAHFRLGVCFRMRSETKRAKSQDVAASDKAWAVAAKIDPTQYIWRRRIQQYGPGGGSLYGWVAQAVSDIVKRGDKPVKLRGNSGKGPNPR